MLPNVFVASIAVVIAVIDDAISIYCYKVCTIGTIITFCALIV